MTIVTIIAAFYLLTLTMIFETKNFKSFLLFRLTPLVLGVTMLLSKQSQIMGLLGK